MLTPSLVMVGAPHFFSRTTLRPLGPSVTLTASASVFMPRSRPRRASSSKAISFGIASAIPLQESDDGRGRFAARDGRPRLTRRTLLAGARDLSSPVRMVVTLVSRVPASCLALCPVECKQISPVPELRSRHPDQPDRAAQRADRGAEDRAELRSARGAVVEVAVAVLQGALARRRAGV